MIGLLKSLFMIMEILIVLPIKVAIADPEMGKDMFQFFILDQIRNLFI